MKVGIVDLAWDELMEKLQSRQLKAVDVLSAYVWKALEVTKKTNCISEFHPKMMVRYGLLRRKDFCTQSRVDGV